MVLIQFTPFVGSDGTTEQLSCGDELGLRWNTVWRADPIEESSWDRRSDWLPRNATDPDFPQ